MKAPGYRGYRIHGVSRHAMSSHRTGRSQNTSRPRPRSSLAPRRSLLPPGRPAILVGLEPDAGPAAVPCCSPAQRERQPDLIHNGPAEFRLSVHGGGSGIRCRGPPEAHDCRSSRYGSRSCHRCRLRSVASRNLAHAPDRRLRTAAAGTFPHFSNRRSSILALASCQTIAGL